MLNSSLLPHTGKHFECSYGFVSLFSNKQICPNLNSSKVTHIRTMQTLSLKGLRLKGAEKYKTEIEILMIFVNVNDFDLPQLFVHSQNEV